MRKDIIRKLSRLEDLTKSEIQEALTDIVEGKSSEGQIGAFIMGMAIKGANEEELTAAAEKFREWAKKLPYPKPEELVDTCGTGGDKVDTFNVSTMTAFVVAAAGVKVAKHGNRAVSSKCGSADFLEALGAKIELSPEGVLKLLEETNLGFLLAPLYHPAMKRVAKVRRELGIKSLFNLVGPLSNPAGAKRQLVGVYSDKLVPVLAKTLKNLGLLKGYVVHGMEGLDEVSITGETLVGEITSEGIKTYTVTPEELGLKRKPLEAIKGGDCKRNVEIFYEILEGKNEAAEDFLAINAAFALAATDRVKNPKEGVELAKEVIRSGKVAETVEKFVKLSQKLQ
jgi:anthranilate phosphoribosyltransferase